MEEKKYLENLEKADIKEINLASNNLDIKTWSVKEILKTKEKREKFEKLIDSLNKTNKTKENQLTYDHVFGQ